jgi:hypothetical protein
VCLLLYLIFGQLVTIALSWAWDLVYENKSFIIQKESRTAGEREIFRECFTSQAKVK